MNPNATADLVTIEKGTGPCDDCGRELTARMFTVRDRATGAERVLGRRCAVKATGYPANAIERAARDNARRRAAGYTLADAVADVHTRYHVAAGDVVYMNPARYPGRDTVTIPASSYGPARPAVAVPVDELAAELFTEVWGTPAAAEPADAPAWDTFTARDFDADAPDVQLALIPTPDPTGTPALF